MPLLFDGEVHVHYGQVYVVSDSANPIPASIEEAFAGQSNGLCGAATAGALFLITGLHTGNVGFLVELLDAEPPLDDAWEEIVEASFTPASSRVTLMEWAGSNAWPLPVPRVDLQARYCAAGMEAGRERDTRLDGEPQLDRYLLQLWPASPEPDRVVKQTSEIAAYWHGVARRLPPPPSAEEVAEAERRAEQERQQRLRQAQEDFERRRWSGRLPGERLGQVGGNVLGLAALDRELVDSLAEADPEAQRAIARWAAHRAYEVAGLARLAWVAPALDALDRGVNLPAPFDQFDSAFEQLSANWHQPLIVVTSPAIGDRGISQQHAALPALIHATAADPLRAALDALWDAAIAFGDRYPVLFDELRRAFPA